MQQTKLSWLSPIVTLYYFLFRLLPESPVLATVYIIVCVCINCKKKTLKLHKKNTQVCWTNDIVVKFNFWCLLLFFRCWHSFLFRGRAESSYWATHWKWEKCTAIKCTFVLFSIKALKRFSVCCFVVLKFKILAMTWLNFYFFLAETLIICKYHIFPHM